MSDEGTYAPRSPDLASFFQSHPENKHHQRPQHPHPAQNPTQNPPPHPHQQQLQQLQLQLQDQHQLQLQLQQPTSPTALRVSPPPQNANWYHPQGPDQAHSRSYSYSALSAQSPTGPAFPDSGNFSSCQPLSAAAAPSYSEHFPPHHPHQQLQSHPQAQSQLQPQPPPPPTHTQPQQDSFCFSTPAAPPPHQVPAPQQPAYQSSYPQHHTYQQQGYSQLHYPHEVQPLINPDDSFHHQHINSDFRSELIKPEDAAEDLNMPPRRSAAAAAAAAAEAEAAGMMESPVKTKFPTARIKRIMQADEEVGKVAQQTPIAVGKALELFMVQLVTKSAEVAREKNSKRVTAAMLKTVVEADDQWDFLRDIVSKVEHDKDGSKAKAANAKTESSDTEEEVEPKRRKGGRKKKAA